MSWTKLDPSQRKAMSEAKQLEVQSWLKEMVCQKYHGIIPKGGLMRMRWVFSTKSAKCKARIVLLGYTDPELLDLPTAAPTLTRRSRQLMLNFCTHRRWAVYKADAKSAFLQGQNHQALRNIFTVPVPELAQQLGIPPVAGVKLLKSAYGLASAPRDWHLDAGILWGVKSLCFKRFRASA